MDEADFAGEQHFHEIERLAMRTELEAGEYLIVKRYPKDPARFLPFALQVLEPAQLTCSGASPRGKNKIDRGVEYDPDTGRRVAYWIDDSGDYGVGRTIRMPAEQVFLNFNPAQPGQRRGISPFAPSVILAKDFDDFLIGRADRRENGQQMAGAGQKNQSGIRGHTQQRGQHRGRRRGGRAHRGAAGRGDRVFAARRGCGAEIPPAAHRRADPGGQADPKPDRGLHGAFSYAMISGDYQDLNYNTLRGQHNDMRMALEPKHARRIRQLNVPVFRDVLDWAALKGRLTLPGYFQNPWPFRACTWHPPVLPIRGPAQGKQGLAGRPGRFGHQPPAGHGRPGRWTGRRSWPSWKNSKTSASAGVLVQDLGSTALDQNPASLGVEQS